MKLTHSINSEDFLGVVIDRDLMFHEHITHICFRATQSFCTLAEIKTILYNSYILK